MENIIDNPNFKNWFKSSKAVNSDGSPMVLYHQTNKENEPSIKDLGFEHGRGRAILSDNGVPNGFFFKPSDDDIGLGENSTQIPVYLSLQNPLVVNNRRELLLAVSEMDMNVHEADYQFYLKDKEYNKKFDSLYKEISASRDIFKARHNELDVILKEWEDWVKSAASEMRELMTNALIKSNYDGVILKNDAGSFNRSVTSYIALYPEQIKSIHNNGEFNPNEKSIMKEKALNEQLTRIKTIMGLNETLITEKLTDIDDDVDLIYNTYFKKDIDNVKETGYVTRDMFKEHTTDSSILKSDLAVKSHELMPITITINKRYYHGIPNFFDFQNNTVGLSINPNAFDTALEFGGNIEKASSYITDEMSAFHFKQEFTEEKIKGSIHHELVHWIDNTLNKGSVKTSKNKYNDMITKQRAKQNEPGSAGDTNPLDINIEYIERQAQIHNIKQFYNKHKDNWDELTFNDLLKHIPTLGIVHKRLNPNLRNKWVRLIKHRMYREGLLGKRMYN